MATGGLRSGPCPSREPNLFCELAAARPAGEGWHHQIGDLADQDALKALVQKAQPEVVLHLAAQPLVRRSYEDPISTWATNVMGSLHLLDALKPLEHPCAVVMVTTDKVYENREWSYGYREPDRLGGHDPYSASKAGAECHSHWRSASGALPSDAPPPIATARRKCYSGGDRVHRSADAMRSWAGEPIPGNPSPPAQAA